MLGKFNANKSANSNLGTSVDLGQGQGQEHPQLKLFSFHGGKDRAANPPSAASRRKRSRARAIPDIYTAANLQTISKKEQEYNQKIQKLAADFAPDLLQKVLAEEAKTKNSEIEKLLSQKALENMTGDCNIDKMSRMIFPLCFILVNVWYYYYYMARREAYKLRGYDTCGQDLPMNE